MSLAWTPSRALAAHLVPAQQIERREQRRLTTGISALDELLGGGWLRGALCEIAGSRGSGRTSVLLTSLATALRQGHCAALVDGDGALDARWARTRARVLADAAMSSAVCDLREQPVSARPVCPDCGGHLVLTGQEARELTTTYEQGITLTRSATICTGCQRRVFPPG